MNGDDKCPSIPTAIGSLEDEEETKDDKADVPNIVEDFNKLCDGVDADLLILDTSNTVHSNVLDVDTLSRHNSENDSDNCSSASSPSYRSSMPSLGDSTEWGSVNEGTDYCRSDSDSEYDLYLFDDVEIEQRRSTEPPLRNADGDMMCRNLLIMSYISCIYGCIAGIQIPTESPKCHPNGSHEGQVPVTDDGNPGCSKKNTYKTPPMPKPSTTGADITPELTILLMWNLIANLLSIFIVAGKIMPHVAMFDCLPSFGADRYLLRGDKEGPSKGRVRRSAAALRQFLAGLIQLPRGNTVDSGAADSVFPASWLRRALLCASPGPLAKQFSVAASGTRLGNLGQFLLKFTTRDGFEGSLMFQVASVNKPLASVSHLADIGYCVEFNRHEGRDGSYLLHIEPNTFWKLRRERGVFVLDAFLKWGIAPRNDSEKIVDAGFTRQEAP